MRFSSMGMSNATAMTGMVLDVRKDAEPWLLGTSFAGIGFGMVLIQALIYWIVYRSDPWSVKLLVTIITLLSTVDFTASVYCTYKMLVLGRDDPHDLIVAPIEAVIPLLTMVLACTLSMGYFGLRAYRIWGGRLSCAAVSLILLCASFGVGMAMVFNVGLGPMIVPNAADLINFDAPNADRTWWFSMHLLQAFLAVSAFSDVVQTAMLLTGLTMRDGVWQRGFNRETDSLIFRVALMAIACGALSTATSVADAVLILVTAKDGPKHVGFCINQTQVYGLTLLATLNLRKIIQASAEGGLSVSSTGHATGLGLRASMMPTASQRDVERGAMLTAVALEKRNSSIVSDVSTKIHVKTEVQSDSESLSEKDKKVLANVDLVLGA